MVCIEPGARNSKRLPVNANGLVRLRSPGSVGSTGRVSTPIWSLPFSLEEVAPPLAIWSKTSVSWSPRKIEMIAGGAEDQELRVVVGGVAREHQVALGRVAQREVDVLAGAVDALERLLVEQALHAVLAGDLLQRDHQQLLVVGGDVRQLEHGS